MEHSAIDVAAGNAIEPLVGAAGSERHPAVIHVLLTDVRIVAPEDETVVRIRAEIASLVPEIDEVLVYDPPWMKATACRTSARCARRRASSPPTA